MFRVIAGKYVDFSDMEVKITGITAILIAQALEKHGALNNIRPIGNANSFARGIYCIDERIALWYDHKLDNGTWSSGLVSLRDCGSYNEFLQYIIKIYGR